MSLPKTSMTLTATVQRPGFLVGVGGGGEFEVAVLAGAEALPFVFEDLAGGPAFLELGHGEGALRGLEAGQGGDAAEA